VLTTRSNDRSGKADLQQPCAVRGDRRHVGGDAPEQRAKQESAEGVVADGIADEDSAWDSPPAGTPAVADNRDGRGRPEQDHEPSTSSHNRSLCIGRLVL
jgi:hypothetical protein